MGQYYMAFDFDRMEFISPSDFGCTFKLMDTCYVGNHFVDALYELLGGRWRDDDVAFVGDYAYGSGTDAERAWLAGRFHGNPWERKGEFKNVAGLWAARADESESRFREVACELGIPSEARLDEKSAKRAVLRLLDAAPVEAAYSEHPACRALAERGIAVRTVYEQRRRSGGKRVLFTAKSRLYRTPKPAPRWLVNRDRRVCIDRARCPVLSAWDDGRTMRYDPLTLFLAVGNGLGGGDYRPKGGAGRAEVGSWAGERVHGADEAPTGFAEIASPFDESSLFLTATDEEMARAFEAIPKGERSLGRVKRWLSERPAL